MFKCFKIIISVFEKKVVLTIRAIRISLKIAAALKCHQKAEHSFHFNQFKSIKADFQRTMTQRSDWSVGCSKSTYSKQGVHRQPLDCHCRYPIDQLSCRNQCDVYLYRDAGLLNSSQVGETRHCNFPRTVSLLFSLMFSSRHLSCTSLRPVSTCT